LDLSTEVLFGLISKKLNIQLNLESIWEMK